MTNYQKNQNQPVLAAERQVQQMQEVQNPGMFHVRDMQAKYKLAMLYCKADIIPKAYQNKPADCLIAIDMADRMGISPVMVMQSLYVVNGKPSWSGQACMSFIQANPNFKDVKPVYDGEPDTPGRGCYMSAKRISDDSDVRGVCVTLAMAQAEGWARNPKWKNMPDLMLAYRAASFFARVHCPAVLMGVAVEGEAEDADTTSIRPERNVEKIL